MSLKWTEGMQSLTLGELRPLTCTGWFSKGRLAGRHLRISCCRHTSKAALLAGGDAAILVLFAVVGRMNHGYPLDLEAFATALPFLLGWFAAAPLLGGFGKDAQSGDVQAAAGTAAKCWAAGVPLGLVFRGLSKGYVPPTPFMLVTLGTTLVLMVGWRTALAALTPKVRPFTVQQHTLKNTSTVHIFSAFSLCIMYTYLSACF